MSTSDVSVDDVLRAVGLHTLGDDPHPEAMAAVLGKLRELAPAAGYAAGCIMSAVSPVEVSWLWPGRIPLGRLTVLDGDPGLGKSSVTLDVAARVTSGLAMPDGSRGLAGPAGVVLLGAEDGLADTVRPRLDAAGADCARVYALTGARDEDGRLRLPTVGDIDAIREAADAVGASLLIIDPLSAYMGRGVDGHRDTDVRQALADLAALAERIGLAILVVRHLSKSGGANPLYRGGGSIALIAAARSGLLLARDPDDADRLVLASTKGNLAPPQPSLGLRLVTTSGAVRVEWLGESSRSAADLLVVEDGDRSARDEAEELLRSELEDGPRPVKELQAAARDAGISWSTVRCAQASLGIVPERSGFGRGGAWTWSLPDGLTIGAQGSCAPMEPGEVGTYEKVAELSPILRVEPAIGAQAPSLGTYGQNRDRTCACGSPIGATAAMCATCRYPELGGGE